MKTAKLVGRKTSDTGADQRHYQLEDGRFVVVSAVCAMFTGPETYIFEADAGGDITSWTELPGSFRGGLDHAEALRGYGYEIVEELSPNDSTLALKRAAIKSMEESEADTREPIFLSDYTDDEKRAIKEALKNNKGKLTTLPAGSTVVNVFPGDLRDWFAGMAMLGILSGTESEHGGYSASDLLAKVSYQTADAMLKARATPTEGER